MTIGNRLFIRDRLDDAPEHPDCHQRTHREAAATDAALPLVMTLEDTGDAADKAHRQLGSDVELESDDQWVLRLGEAIL